MEELDPSHEGSEVAMPHDNKNNKLQVGDTVLVPCVVTEIYEADEYCNVNLKTVRPMYPSDNPTSIVLNTRQVDKLPITPGRLGGDE
jgi:hypothetical protein